MLGRATTLVRELQMMLDVLAVIPSRRGRARLIWLWWAMLLKQEGRLRRDFVAELTWTGPAGPLTATISDLSELKVIREIFVGREYVAPQGLEPRTIVDLGSHAGLSVLFFKALYPQARIIAVEAHPVTFQRLLVNTAHLPSVELLNAAVTDHDGHTTLYSGSESWAAALTEGTDRGTAITTRAITLGRIIEEFALDSVDLLKMDIEGSEHEVVASSESVLGRIAAIILEYHQEHHAGTLWTLLDELSDFELVRFKGDSGVHPLVTLTRC